MFTDVRLVAVTAIVAVALIAGAISAADSLQKHGQRTSVLSTAKRAPAETVSRPDNQRVLREPALDASGNGTPAALEQADTTSAPAIP